MNTTRTHQNEKPRTKKTNKKHHQHAQKIYDEPVIIYKKTTKKKQDIFNDQPHKSHKTHYNHNKYTSAITNHMFFPRQTQPYMTQPSFWKKTDHLHSPKVFLLGVYRILVLTCWLHMASCIVFVCLYVGCNMAARLAAACSLSSCMVSDAFLFFITFFVLVSRLLGFNVLWSLAGWLGRWLGLACCMQHAWLGNDMFVCWFVCERVVACLIELVACMVYVIIAHECFDRLFICGSIGWLDY